MKQSAINGLRRLHVFTNALCATCEPKFGCCSPLFCDIVAAGLIAVGRPVPPRGAHPELRFMGPSGCTIEPELRPGCTGFVCQEKLQDRKVRREYDRLQAKAFDDPEVEKMRDVAKRIVDGIMGKPRPCQGGTTSPLIHRIREIDGDWKDANG